MIKLVVTDMDGTLLNEQKELPKNFDQMVNRLHEIGIIFVIGSGRQYQSLRKMFESHLDHMAFICDNGTFIYENDELVDKDLIKPHHVDVMLERLIPFNVPLVLSGTQGAHRLVSEDEKINTELSHYYEKQVLHNSYNEIDDGIGKIAILDFSEELPLEHLFDDIDDITLVRSGAIWWDVMATGVDKGKALSHYQKLKGITKDETIVFGDYMNDYEMLQEATYSFAMENAVDEIKKVSRFVAPSNNDEGVMQVLTDLVEGNFYQTWQK